MYPATKNTPKAKGVRTFVQSVPGFVIGYFATIWAVPGVSDATAGYLKGHGTQLILTLGLSSAVVTGIISWVVNRVEDSRR